MNRSTAHTRRTNTESSEREEKREENKKVRSQTLTFLRIAVEKEVSWHRGGGGGEGGVEERTDPANASASQGVEPTKIKVRKLVQGTSGGQAVAPCDLIYGGHGRGGVPRSEEEKGRATCGTVK